MSFGLHDTTAQVAPHAEIMPEHNQGWGPNGRVWNSSAMGHFVPKSSWQGGDQPKVELNDFRGLIPSGLSLPLSQPA